MALRICFKIHRYLEQNKFNFLVHEQTRNTSSKPKDVKHPLRQLKSSSHTNLVQKKCTNTRPTAVSLRERDLQKSEYEMYTFENYLQPSAMPEYFTSKFDSNSANFPEKSNLVRRRFSKSSTQNPLTKPLKLPRLVNPSPERLKSFPSDKMADGEKAKLMQEEVKMVDRYNLQKSHEAAYQHLEQSRLPEGPLHYEDDVRREAAEIPQLQPPAATDEALLQNKRPQVRNKSESKARKRAPRTLNQQRRFSSMSSTQNPLSMSDLERCDIIWEHLRAQCPEYWDYKKPAFMPGSAEERGFIEHTFWCLAKHKQNNTLVKRAPAPFPSYSEVKTFVREPCMRQIKESSVGPTQTSSRDNLVLTRNYSSTTTYRPTAKAQQNGRCFSTKSKSCKPDKKKKPTCTPMKSEGYADPNPNRNEYVFEKSKCKKVKAPYPSYSECMGHLYEEEPAECKICPWRINKPTSSDNSSSGKKQDQKLGKRISEPTPGHKKSFSTLVTAKQPFHTTSEPAQCATLVDRIRGWLNSWRPGSDNIRITQSSDVSAGRETYIIEMQDVLDSRHPEVTAVTSSGLACAESSGKVSGGGCPAPKKQEDQGEDKKKCRQRRKRKLPSCNDVGKNKPSKDAQNYSTIKITDPLSQQTQEINALQEPQVPENVPFKLKPQFWRV